jgi:cytoskeletal protein RodZ
MTQQLSTFGDELRRERELRQISLREVADSTKINLRYLEALEKNDFEDLPGGVFNRGFVRAYAQFIGVDPDAMVNAYLLEDRARNGEAVAGQQTIMRGYKTARENRGPLRHEGGGSRGLWLAIGAVLVLALGGGGWFYFSWNRPAVDGPGQETSATHDSSDSIEIPPVEKEPPTPTAKRPAATKTEPPTEAAATPPPMAAQTATPRSTTTIYVDRAVSGRLNCDNRQIELLDGMRPGTRLTFACTSYLIVDASDAGALRISLPGRATVSLGPDGQSLSSHRIDMSRDGGETTP